MRWHAARTWVCDFRTFKPSSSEVLRLEASTRIRICCVSNVFTENTLFVGSRACAANHYVILEKCPVFVRYALSNRRSSISRIVVDPAFVVAFGKCRMHNGIDISYFDMLCFSQQANVCTVVPGDLFHILTKGRRYFVLSLFISIAHCLLWSNILIAV